MIQAAEAFLNAVINDDDTEIDPKTPERFARMLLELTTPTEFEFTTFPNDMKRNEMVVVGPVHFVALCSHHVVPFVGSAWIGYIPDELIAGLSKFARAVKWASKGLWTQEQLTDYITNYLEDELNPHGLAVLMEAEHMCMTIRGVQSPGTRTITMQVRGWMLDPPSARRNPKDEFLEHVRRQSNGH